MNPDATNWPPSRALTAGYVIAIAALLINTIVTYANMNVIRMAWDTVEGGRDFAYT